MDRKTYINIRKQVNFEIDPKMLPLQLAQDFILCLAGALLLSEFNDSWICFLSIPIFSLVMFRNFSLMHEAVHNSISKNKKINNFFGVISGALCLLPYEQWKAVHLEHHYWSGNIEKDPVMAIVRTYANWPPLLKNTLNASWKAWIPMIATLQYGVFWFHSTLHFLKSPTSGKQLVSIAVPFLFWAFMLIKIPTLCVQIFLPSVLLYLLMAEVVNLPHHLEMKHYNGDTKFNAWEQYQTARSCLYPLWMSRFVVLNFNYHIEHHMFPDAPWYILDQLHKLVKPEIKDQYKTDGQFSWILKNRPRNMADFILHDQPPTNEQHTAA